MKKVEEESLEEYYNSENENTFEEFQEVLSRVYADGQNVDFTEIPVGLYTFYEVNNQIQSPTNSFLLADFISEIQAKEEKEDMYHYNIRRTQINYSEGEENETIVKDEDFYVPKPMGPMSVIKPMESEPTVTLHNLKVETYKKSAPKRVVDKGECADCELSVHKISIDIYNRENNEVEHVEWEIATDFIGYISSDFELYDGTVSRCNKRWIEVDEDQNVLLSQCWVLRDYGIFRE